MKKLILAGLLAASLPAFAGQYFVVVPVPGKTTTADSQDINVSLASATLPAGLAGQQYPGFNFNAALSVTGDPEFSSAGVSWNVDSGSLPAGLTLNSDGTLSGIPTATGEFSIALTAEYKSKSSAPASYSLSVAADIKDNGGYRTWSDGSLAASCQDYRGPSAPYTYTGDTGDGVYRINLAGTPTDVYCNQTLNGGGWTLLMKQAQGDGATLQGDTTYWTNGTTLNDNVVSLNMNDGNYVSAAFSRMMATQYVMQAANESSVRTATTAAQTPLVTFSTANRTVYSDAPGVPQTYPDWFVHATTYPSGPAITQSRFGINFMEASTSVTGPIQCGVRWGWASNENTDANSNGSDDMCGGLGAYGPTYGGAYSKNNKGAWQPATLYLWAK